MKIETNIDTSYLNKALNSTKRQINDVIDKVVSEITENYPVPDSGHQPQTVPEGTHSILVQTKGLLTSIHFYDNKGTEIFLND